MMKSVLECAGIILGTIAIGGSLILFVIWSSDSVDARVLQKREALSERINSACLTGFHVSDWEAEKRVVRVYCESNTRSPYSVYAVAVPR